MYCDFDRKELKKSAKSKLSNNLGVSILVLGLLSILVGSLMNISSEDINPLFFSNPTLFTVLGWVGIVIAMPFEIGFAKLALNICKGDVASTGDAFYGFKIFGKALLAYITVTAIILVGTLLFIVPGLIFAYGFYFVPEVLADNSEIGVIDAFKESWRLTTNFKMQLFVLNMSFIGWFIVVFCTLGLAALWVNPYITLTNSEVYLDIKKNKAIPENNVLDVLSSDV